MAEGHAVVRNSAGIHVRPSGVISEKFIDYTGRISLRANGMEIELQSVVGLIALGLQQGDEVEVSVEGPDDENICAELVLLLETEFDFPPRK